MNIDGILEWNYEKAKISEAGTVKLEIKEWKNERHAIIRASEYALKRMFLNFRVMSSEGVEVARLSLNMFLILTGPWRHDFPIKYNQGHMGRLSADIRCTQTIELNMAPTKVQLNFLKEHPGDMFHFTLKTEVVKKLYRICLETLRSRRKVTTSKPSFTTRKESMRWTVKEKARLTETGRL